MSNDKLSFLDDKPAVETEAKPPEPATSEATPATGEHTRDEQGRFTAKVEPPVAPVETKQEPLIPPVAPAAAEVVPPPKEDHNPLLPKYLDTYNRLRDAEKELADYKAREKEKAEMPDPLLDPEGFKAAQDKALDERLWDVRVATSEIAAKRFYGKDVVKAAFDALQAQNDPLLGMRIRRSADPWEEIVQWHKKEQLLAEIGEDPTAYKARIIAEHLAQQQQAPAGGPPATAPPQNAAPPIPPASLSRAPAGQRAADVPVGEGQAFDAAFRH